MYRGHDCLYRKLQFTKNLPEQVSFTRSQNTMSIYSIFKKEYFYTLTVDNWKFKNFTFHLTLKTYNA